MRYNNQAMNLTGGGVKKLQIEDAKQSHTSLDLRDESRGGHCGANEDTEGAYSFVACLSRMTIDLTSLPRQGGPLPVLLGERLAV